MKGRIQAGAQSLERRVSDLYDFSLDIARYDGDLNFARNGGTIHYVLDENILEMFVNPSGFYGYVMREEARPTSDPTPREIQAMQTALLTGEALLSGTLPGQLSGTCYLTEWHRWEALERVSTFISDLSRLEPDQVKDAMHKALRVKAGLTQEEDVQTGEHEDVDPFLEEDLLSLTLVAGVDARAARHFRRVRQASAVLARETRSEPIHQVSRILKADASGLLANITSLDSPDSRDLSRLAKSAREWAFRIKLEADSRAARSHSQHGKGATAIWNDAQSLAVIDWISRRLDPNTHRVVFVTGDPTVFDSYRRWYESSIARNGAGTGPFLLRRPVQYSALFSSDPGGISKTRQQLFYSLQQLVELPLTPIRMASVVDESSIRADEVVRRHSLTLRPLNHLTDSSIYFGQVWKAHGHKYRTEQIEAVENQIAKTERLLNGLSGHLVERRILDEQRELFHRMGGDQSERDRLISQYIDNAVEDLIRSALEIWRPEAESFFRRAAREGPRRGGRHVPLAINFGPGSRLAGMLDALIEDPIEEGSGGRTVSFQVESTFDIFVGAAAVAIHGNQWRLGDHFCEVAINAFTYLSRHEASTRSDASEAHYLSALAKRFRLGEIRARENLRGYEQATRLHDNAIELLRKSEELAGGIGTGFGSYRAFSERAALSLFYAAVCAMVGSKLSGVRQQGKVQLSATRAYQEAGAYLSEALKVERRSDEGLPEPELFGSPAGRVRLQILINIAAWHALRPLVGQRSDQFARPDLARELARNMAPLERILVRVGSPLFHAELLAFKISQGIDVAGSRQRLASVSANQRAASVEVDRQLLEEIKDAWQEHEEAKPQGSD